MKSALVIGAGWAGLSAAVELADRGWKVRLLEQSGRLGGRASSFVDESGATVDNGQHLFMGCYLHTLRFLKKVGSLQRLQFQKDLAVDFVRPGGKLSSLRCLALPAPLHLFSGLLGLDTLSFKEKWAMARVYRAVKSRGGNGELKSLTAEDWLAGLGQSERSRRYFWDPIVLATLNEQASVADADSLAVVLREAFFKDPERSQIAIAAAGLSELCGPPAQRYLAARGGGIELNQLVSKIVLEGDRVERVELRDGAALRADAYVSALPFFVLRNALGEEPMRRPFFAPLARLESSPIFSVSLWFDRAITDRRFVGMLDTRVQWLFNKSLILGEPPGYVSLVISGARSYLGLGDEEILKFCLDELHQCFPASRGANLLRSLIVREKNATLSPRVGAWRHRLPQKTPVGNLFLCGDWTDTGFPATIESAVASGAMAADALDKEQG